MSKAIGTEEFAVAMQQLSAEAEKTRPGTQAQPNDSFADQPESAGLAKKFDALNARLEGLESALLSRLEQIAAAAPQVQFQKIEEPLNAIRGTKSVNQKLFDSLHAELLKYRDNFLHESLQKPFIHDLVYLYDHLNSLCEQLRAAALEKGERDPVGQWH